VLVGDSAAALALSARLEALGFYVPAVRPPTVPPGKARLRLTLSALHAESDVEQVLQALDAARA
jgi:8-amino-7-oxononanoate synthase